MRSDEAHHQEQENQQWLDHVKLSREYKQFLEEISGDRDNRKTAEATGSERDRLSCSVNK